MSLQNGSGSSFFTKKQLQTVPPTKLFGRASLRELEPEPERSSSKHEALIASLLPLSRSFPVDRISSAVHRGVSHEGRLIGRDACNREQEGNRDTQIR